MLRSVLLALVLMAAAPAQAAGARSGPVEVVQPWSRPAVAGFNGAGFMTLVNHGRRPEALTAVESPAAARVEMHRSQMTGGVMSMGPVSRVEVPAGGSVRFAPGGYHLMFMGLKRALNPGDHVPATLVFQGGRRIQVAFEVTSGAPPAAPSVGHSDAGR